MLAAMVARLDPFFNGILGSPRIVQACAWAKPIPRDQAPRSPWPNVEMHAPPVKSEPADPWIVIGIRSGLISKLGQKHRRRGVAIQRPPLQMLTSHAAATAPVPRLSAVG